MISAEKRHQKAKDALSQDKMNNLILSTKGFVKGMKQEHTPRMSMKQCLSTITYLQNE